MIIDATGVSSGLSVVPNIANTYIGGMSLICGTGQAINISYGGGSAAGQITLDRLEIRNNAYGIAAADVLNPITISNTTIAENTSTAILLNSVDVHIFNTTISGNQSTGYAGGISINGGSATIVNSTITNNRSAKNNTSSFYGAGGLFAAAGAITLHNSIVAGNFAGATDMVLLPTC